MPPAPPTEKQKRSRSPELPEKIRPERNLERWSLWQPANSRRKPKARIFRREIPLAGGDRIVATVKVGFTDEGALTTEDQKTYYALVMLWEEARRSGEPTLFSLRQLAAVLKKRWGSNVLVALTSSLSRLRFTPFTWQNAYYDSTTRETVRKIETFTILEVLEITRREGPDGAVNRETCAFRFNDYILRNLLAGHTKPLLLETVLGFQSEVAQMLYTHLDLILSDKDKYERRTKELFGDLGLEGGAYAYLSDRKRVLQRAFKELQGVPLSTGTLVAATLEPTKDATDYKAVFRKGRRQSPGRVASPSVEETLPTLLPPPPVDPGAEAEELARYFLRVFFGDAAAPPPLRAVEQAADLLSRCGPAEAQFVVDFAHREAPKTNFPIKTFGGVLQYEPAARGAFAQEQEARRQQEAQAVQEMARRGHQAAHRATILAEGMSWIGRLEKEAPEAFLAFTAHVERELEVLLKRHTGKMAQESFRKIYAGDKKRVELLAAYFTENSCPLPELSEWLREHPVRKLQALLADER
jgi:hypothetical protein